MGKVTWLLEFIPLKENSFLKHNSYVDSNKPGPKCLCTSMQQSKICPVILFLVVSSNGFSDSLWLEKRERI